MVQDQDPYRPPYVLQVPTGQVLDGKNEVGISLTPRRVIKGISDVSVLQADVTPH